MGKWLVIVVIAGVLSSLSASAQYGAVSTATAGSGRAAIEPTESSVLNPASIPFSRGYFATSEFSTLYGGQEFGVALTDNLPDTLVPTSLLYTQINSQQIEGPSQNFTTQDLRLQFGTFVTPKWAFGLTVQHKIDHVDPLTYTQTNVLLGSIYAFNENFGVAAVLDNVIAPDNSVPMAYQLLPSVALGLNYNYVKQMRFKLDVITAGNNSFNQPTVAAGLESHWNRWLVMRMGASKILQQNLDEYGGGVGFSGPKFAVHYGYLNCPQQDKLTRHAVDFAIPIW